MRAPCFARRSTAFGPPAYGYRVPLTIAETVWCQHTVLRRLPDDAIGTVSPPAGARRFLGRWSISVLETFTRIGTIDLGYTPGGLDKGSELTALVLTDDVADRMTYGVEAVWAMIDWASLGGAECFAVQTVVPTGPRLEIMREVGLSADESRPGVWHATSKSLRLPLMLGHQSPDWTRFQRNDA